MNRQNSEKYMGGGGGQFPPPPATQWCITYVLSAFFGGGGFQLCGSNTEQRVHPQCTYCEMIFEDAFRLRVEQSLNYYIPLNIAPKLGEVYTTRRRDT